jgi:hypothetical protein
VNLYVSRRYQDIYKLHKQLRREFSFLELPNVPTKSEHHLRRTEHYYRERDRLLLRSYLRRLNKIPIISQSTIFLNFLTHEPIQLSELDIIDMERRSKREMQLQNELKKAQETTEMKMKQVQQHLINLRRSCVLGGEFNSR